MPSDRLVDLVWGMQLPPNAGTALSKEVYRLRTSLTSAGDQAVLVTQPPGYRLNVADDQVDAQRFTTLVAQAQHVIDTDPAGAVSLCERALAFWHGPPWGEFADEEFAQPLVAGLGERRALALECRADALLTVGRHDEAVLAARQAVSDYPLRERPRALLMRALYVGGRHAEALSAFREFQALLSDELGLDPSPELRELERDILRQQVRPAPPPLSPTPPVGRVLGLPQLDGRFVGRRKELAWLEVLVARASTGERPVVAAMVGPAGVGKTSLATVFGRMLSARGAAVGYLRCSPGVAVSAQVLELLGEPAAGSSSGHGQAGDDVSAVVAALRRFGDGRLVVLLLDDADEAPESTEFVRRLAATRASLPVCVVVLGRTTADDCRPGPFSTTEPMLRLSGLSCDEVADVLGAVSSVRSPTELAQSVWSETGGIPGLAVAVARRLEQLDVRSRADAALARAAAARRGLDLAQHEIARGVLAGVALSEHGSPGRPPAHPDRAQASTCPYKGLAPFGRSDAALFCGRERLVAALISKLAVDRFLAVIGPSGSGKSSLVAAGLVPTLPTALPGGDRWPCLLVRPGADPLGSLAHALTPLIGTPTETLRHQLDANAGALHRVCLRALDLQDPRGERCLLVVDQFEELFTACPDPATRARFVGQLTAATSDDEGPVSVVLVLRADFYGNCADYPELATAMSRSQMLVTALTDDEMRRVVTEPARRTGLLIEDGLADTVCQDAAAQAGALPLVSTALLETWVNRSGSTLTHAGYLSAGGVRGAVARLAESLWAEFDQPERSACRRILLRLSDPERDTSDVRRKAHRSELASAVVEQKVLARLIERRLLTASADTVEIAHEALQREWPRLRDWLEDDREGRRVHRRLADAAIAWEADRRDDAGLYRGVRLAAARDWAGSHPGDANRLETEFLTASEDAEQRVLQHARRAARRLRGLAGGLAALLVAAVVAGVLAASQRSQARHEAALARQRALDAELSRGAALASTLPVNEQDIALLLGAQGYRLQPSDQTVGGLQAALVHTPPGLDRIIRYPTATFLPHLDHTGRLLAASGSAGATVENVGTGAVVRTLSWPRPREFAVFSGDDTLVAAGGFDGQIAIWNAATGALAGAPLHVGGTISYAVFNPTNRNRLYAVTNTGLLTTWDRHDAAHPQQVGPARRLRGGGGSSIATVSRDGRLLAAGSAFGGPVTIWNTATGQKLWSAPGTLGDFAADNTTLPVSEDNRVVLYDARTGHPTTTIPITGGGLPGVVLAPGGRRIAVAQAAEHSFQVHVYDVTSREPLGAPIRLHGNAAIPVGFLPDGRLVTTGNNEAAVWTVGRTLPPLAISLPAKHGDINDSIFLPKTEAVVTAAELDGRLIWHNTTTGAAVTSKLSAHIQSPFAPDPNGEFVAAGQARADRVAIWDTATGQRLATLPRVPEGATLAWSPSGRQLVSMYGPTAQLWDTTNPAHPRPDGSIRNAEHGVGPDQLLYSPDGRHLVIAEDADRRLTVYDVERRRPTWAVTITDLTLAQAAISPDGKTVAVSSGDAGKGQVTLYDTETGAVHGRTTAQSAGGLSYLHHGQWLIVTSSIANPGAQLYDARTLQPIGVPFPINNPGLVAANATGTKFSESEPDAPLLWDANPRHWIQTACRIAGRNLTRAEWRQYLPNTPYRRTCPQWPTGQ